MSLNGVTGGAAAILRPQEIVRPRVEQERTVPVAPQPPVARPQAKGAGLLAPRQDTLPAEAPSGTDPALWQVLTAEERAHFAKMTAMGPLTYGRRTTAGASPASQGAETPLARGGRIDVKV